MKITERSSSVSLKEFDFHLSILDTVHLCELYYVIWGANLSPCVRKVREIIHECIADVFVGVVEILTKIDSSVGGHERGSQETVDVIQVGSVDPFRIANQKTLPMFELVLISGSGTPRSEKRNVHTWSKSNVSHKNSQNRKHIHAKIKVTNCCWVTKYNKYK